MTQDRKGKKILNLPKRCSVGESRPAYIYTENNRSLSDTCEPVLKNAHVHTGKH